MSGLAKGLIITGVVLVVMVIAVVGAGVYWVSKHGPEFVEKGKQAANEGKSFGKGTDNQGCLTEGLSRYEKAPGLGSAISTQIFLQTCLETSRATPGFCDDVPAPGELMKSAQWRTAKCTEAGLPDSYCQQLFASVQEFCHASPPTN